MAEDGRLKRTVRTLAGDARQAIVGVVTIAVLALAWQLLGGGDVPAWVLGAVIIVLGFAAYVVIGGLLQRIDRITGERDEARRNRDEARQQRDEAQQRLVELQRQTAGAADADLPVAPEARALVRRIRALRTNIVERTGYNQTTGAETANLTAIIRDLEALVGNDNSAIREAHKHWISGSSEHLRDSAQVTLDQLEAVASEYREPGKSWAD
jgi:type II secretory pathway pseudopilin PulG